MAILLFLVSLIVGLGSFVCFIIVLTKLFPAEGVLAGIFGVICGFYTFIRGWQNAERYDLEPVMTMWTIFFVASLALRFLAFALGS